MPFRQLEDSESKKSPTIRVGYAGRLSSDKRSSELLQYWRLLRETDFPVELWIAGSGELETDLQKLQASDPRVRYFGALTREQLYESFYPELDIFVHFSDAEGWGLSIGEAMIHGVVPVVSSFHGLSSGGLLFPGKNCLTFEIGNVQEASKKTVQVMNSSTLRSNLSKSAESHVRTHFAERIVIKKWDSMLNTLFDQPVPSFSIEEHQNDRIEGIRESLRRLTRRRFPHATAREEWPHYEQYRLENSDLAKIVESRYRNQQSSALVG